MELSEVEKHIQKIERERNELFIKSLDFIGDSNTNLRNYYLIMAILSGVVLILAYQTFFNVGRNNILTWTIIFSILSLIFAIVNYLNALEKGVDKIAKYLVNLDYKYKQENRILKNFYSGKIDGKDVRNFYLNKSLEINKKYFDSSREVLARWSNFILLAIALSLLVLFIFDI